MIKKINQNPISVLKTLDLDQKGFEIMAQKCDMQNFLISNLDVVAANILKQDALSIGAELAMPRSAITHSQSHVNCLLMCTKRQLKTLIKKEKSQSFGLKTVAGELENYAKIKKYPLEIMGILNLNEDSFFAPSRTKKTDLISKAAQMITDGADIIDIGGVSSRPGSTQLSPKDELERIKPFIDLLYEHKIYEQITLSLDSFLPLPLQYALDKGFKIVNDITGLENDEVCKISAKYKARVCIMHMQSDPTNMQKAPHYTDVIAEVKSFLSSRIQKAKDYGITDIMLDVGIGFGKNLEHNLALIKHHEDFLSLGYPLLIGASNKSLINDIYPSALEDRLTSTVLLHTKAVEFGASIVRCHNVKEHVRAFKILNALS